MFDRVVEIQNYSLNSCCVKMFVPGEEVSNLHSRFGATQLFTQKPSARACRELPPGMRCHGRHSFDCVISETRRKYMIAETRLKSPVTDLIPVKAIRVQAVGVQDCQLASRAGLGTHGVLILKYHDFCK